MKIFKLVWYAFLLGIFLWLLFHLSLIRYGISQARGFYRVWKSGKPVAEMSVHPMLAKRYQLMQKAFAYAAGHGLDTSGAFAYYLPDEKGKQLMVVSASARNQIKPYCWNFPLLGDVPYKGFYDRHLLLKEVQRLKSESMDVDTSQVPAWSSLGWFSEIMTPGFYNKPDKDFTETVFHELTHRCIYLYNAPDLNENIAQACGEFLNARFWGAKNTLPSNEPAFGRMMCRLVKRGNTMYAGCKNSSQLQECRLRFIRLCIDSVYRSGYFPTEVNRRISKRLGQSLNAFMSGYASYYSNKDSLMQVLDKDCKGNLRVFFNRIEAAATTD